MVDAAGPANRTFDELAVGDAMSITRELGPEDVALVSAMGRGLLIDEGQGDGYVTSSVGYAGWAAALVPAVLATVLPGPGTVYRSQSLQFIGEIHHGDVLTMTVTVLAKHPDTKGVDLDCVAVNQRNQTVVRGWPRSSPRPPTARAVGGWPPTWSSTTTSTTSRSSSRAGATGPRPRRWPTPARTGR